MRSIVPGVLVPLAITVATSALLGAGTAHAAPLPTAAARAFLRVELPRRDVYVGESIPLTVRAYFRADTGASLTGAPTLDTADFTLQTSNPVQGTETIGGERYRTITWKDQLSPVKAGSYPMNLALPSTLEWREISRRDPRTASVQRAPADLFGGDDSADSSGNGGDPFDQMSRQMQRMQQLMMRNMQTMEDDVEIGPSQHKDVVLRSTGAKLNVRALPAAGQPPGFTGAVGRFTLSDGVEPASTPLQTPVGEPLTLVMRVAGQGNFDRVSLTGLAASADWKTYGPTAADGDHEKVFRQPIVALRAGVPAIPPVSFGYFDPTDAAYKTLTTAPLPVDVAAGSGAVAASDGKVPTAASGPALAPNAVNAGARADLRPLFVRPGFWKLQAALFAAFVAGLFVTRRQLRKNADLAGPRRRQAERAVQSYREVMDRALAHGDSATFFAAARGAVQERLGLQWNVAPAAISLSEIEARLEATDVQRLRPVFDADAARFSGAAPQTRGETPVDDLPGWKRIVDDELEHLAHLEPS